jgi:hypothetical protein
VAIAGQQFTGYTRAAFSLIGDLFKVCTTKGYQSL